MYLFIILYIYTVYTLYIYICITVYSVNKNDGVHNQSDMDGYWPMT